MVDPEVLSVIDSEIDTLCRQTDHLEGRGGAAGIGLFRRTRVGQLRGKIKILRDRRDLMVQGRSQDEPGSLLADIRCSQIGL
ncbi:hypothetical protein EON79_01370 [bacterium]|nr:MAG: hypothetical protein EON79_01370 [bacterium]